MFRNVENTCSECGLAYKFEKSIVDGIGGGASTIETLWGCWFVRRSDCSWWCRWRCRWCEVGLESSVSDSYFFGYFLLTIDPVRSDQSWWKRGTFAWISRSRCNSPVSSGDSSSIALRFSAYVPSMTGMPLSPGGTDLDVLKWEINSLMQMKWNDSLCVCESIHLFSIFWALSYSKLDKWHDFRFRRGH